jgi:hypothetical protein
MIRLKLKRPKLLFRAKGSATSGNWGHAGRINKRGGSAKRSVAMSISTGRDWQRRQALKRAESTKRNSGGMASVYRHEFKDWEARVKSDANEAQFAAIDDYTANGYRDTNNVLRTGDTPQFSDTLDQIQGLDAALAAAPKVKADTVVYRGMNAKRLESLKVGDVYQDKGFVSTSVDFGASFADHSSAKMTIVLPKDSKAGAYVERLSSNSRELEWIMPRGSMFEILDKVREPNSDKFVFTLLYVGAQPGPVASGKGFGTKQTISKDRVIDKFSWNPDDLVLVKKGKKK